MRRRWHNVLLVLAALVIAGAMVAVWQPRLFDYNHAPGNPNNAGPALWAVARGDFGELPRTQPLMGGASLILRAPFAALGNAVGDLKLEYWLGVFACLATLAVLALALGAEARRRGTVLTGLFTAGLVLLNPPITTSVTYGHPEELLLAAAAVGGVWATVRGRAISGGALAGIAVGTLPFGIAGVVAAAFATRVRRAATVVTAVLVGLLLILPLPLSSPHTYLDGNHSLSQRKRVYPQTVWWWVSPEHPLLVDLGGKTPERTTQRLMPAGLDRGAGLLIALAAGCACTWLILRRSRGQALGHEALGLLALLFLLRSAFDPQNLEYYVAPSIVALIAWEVLARGRVPLVSTAFVAADAFIFHTLAPHPTPAAILYTVWCCTLGGYLLASTRVQHGERMQA